MRNKMALIIALVSALALGASIDASAGSSRSSSFKSSSSKSFSFSNASRYSKPSWPSNPSKKSSSKPASSSGWGTKKTETKASTKPASSSGWGTSKVASSTPGAAAKSATSNLSPKTQTSAVKPSTSAKQTALAKVPTKTVEKQRMSKAYADYQTKQAAKYKTPSRPIKRAALSESAVYRTASVTRKPNYWDRRDRFYNGWQAPTYVYQGAPSYGMFDGMFLGYMLGHATTPSYASFAYNHQNDPGMQAWMRDMELQAETNVELRGQLNELKAQMAAMNGNPIDPSYMPSGIDADMAISPELAKDLKPTFRLCTASAQGNYNRFGSLLRAQEKNSLNVELVQTTGSMQNLSYLELGQCDGAYVQRNAFTSYADRHPEGKFAFERIATPAVEYAHLICNRDSDVDDISDLPGKRLLIDNKGSGTEVTWSEFVEENSDYRAVETDTVGGMAALNQVVVGRADCMLYVASLNSPLMQKAQLSDKLVLRPVDDGALNEAKQAGRRLFAGHKDQSGEDVYLFRDIPDGQYGKLQDGWIFSSVETLTVPVDMVASLKWSESNPAAYDDLLTGVMSVQPKIDQLTNEH